MLSSDEILDLHRTLVSQESISGNEQGLVTWLCTFFESKGVKAERLENNVIVRTGNGKPLLFNSHLDTVPANSSWTRDPWHAESVDGKVFGLGSNDAKASVTAMISCFMRIHDAGGPVELTLMLVAQEETGGRGTEFAWPTMRKRGYMPEGIVVGEPTGLNIGTSQKGLMILELLAEGDACHAANARQLGAKNPVYQLAADLKHLEEINLGPEHPLLGETTLQPTMLMGSQASNQVPGVATAVLDLRTVPGMSNTDLLERLRSQVTSEIRPRSIRLEPYDCADDASIVIAAKAARPQSVTFGSPTMSDQVFFTGFPTIKCGPGLSERSHTGDEFVLESEILEGADFYFNLCEAFARG